MFDIKYLGTFLVIFGFLFFIFKILIKQLKFINGKTFFNIFYIDEIVSAILSLAVLLIFFHWD